MRLLAATAFLARLPIGTPNHLLHGTRYRSTVSSSVRPNGRQFIRQLLQLALDTGALERAVLCRGFPPFVQRGKKDQSSVKLGDLRWTFSQHGQPSEPPA
jgi:hypothetical protein